MIYFLYPQLRKLSGAERLILRLAAHSAALGARVTLVTHHFDAACRPELDPSVRLIETGYRSTLFHNHYLDAPLEYLASLRLIDRIGDDAEAVTFFGPPSLPALSRSKRGRRKTVPHLYFCYEPPRFIYDDTREIVQRTGVVGRLSHPFFGLYRQLDRRMAQRADILLANSEFGAARLRSAYGRGSVVITHGADLPSADPRQVQALCVRYNLSGKQVLTTVNYLHPRKRIDLFLRAFQIVHHTRPDTAALVVGAGPEAARLRALAAELGISDSVGFTGFVPEGDLPAHYALAQLYVHTGKLESFGLSVLEASAAGVPVVSVDEGGPREIVQDGSTGRLVPATPEDLAQAALTLLGDEALRLTMGQAAQKRTAERYSWDKGACTFLETVECLK